MTEQVKTRATGEKREQNTSHKKISEIPESAYSSDTDSLAGKILFLQRTIGNRAVERLIRSRTLQAKLRIGQPGDKYEQEADRVAEQVMRMPEPAVSNGMKVPENFTSNPIQRNTSELESSVGGGGQPLPESARAFYESRFGQDFSEVRLHTGLKAADSALGVNARAFAVGKDVVFGAGQYAPETYDGRKLLAHELAHVVQQSSKMNFGSNNVLMRFPSPSDCHTFKPGLSYMKPIIKEGYDGKTYTAIKTGWSKDSWERRWQIYDAEDKLLYESYYTWPQPTLYIPIDVIAKGKAAGAKTPWSVWLKVTKTLVPFGGSDNENFPHTYMKFFVYDTWNQYMADPNARLSTVEQAGVPSRPNALEKPVISGTRSVIDYGSVVAMHEAYLREIYDSSARAITETARDAVTKGAPQGEVAKWAVESRNELKAKIRADGNPILKRVFEARNLKEYGNKLGPSYEQLFQKYSKQGFSPEEINKKIIGSAGKANIKVNRWSGRLRIAGRIMLVIDIALAGVRVYLAPEGEKTRVALEEVARIGGAIALGAVGAKAGAAAGAAIGALFAGVGAAPGAIIGGIIGGIGGAIFGGWLGKTVVEKLYEMFPPSDCVFEGDFKLEDRSF